MNWTPGFLIPYILHDDAPSISHDAEVHHARGVNLINSTTLYSANPFKNTLFRIRTDLNIRILEVNDVFHK